MIKLNSGDQYLADGPISIATVRSSILATTVNLAMTIPQPYVDGLEKWIQLGAGPYHAALLGTFIRGSYISTTQNLVAIYAGGGSDAVKTPPTLSTTTGGTAGSEVVTVVGNAVSVSIESGVSTATQIFTALNGSRAANQIFSIYTTGTASTPQTAASFTFSTTSARFNSVGDYLYMKSLGGLWIPLNGSVLFS